jgi:signal transduction histidine kinase/DNA-binding response OmpR family regulator
MSLPAVRSLRLRFVYAIAALVALVLVANGLVLALSNRAHLRDDLERHAQAYAQLAVGPICNTYDTYYTSGYSKFHELIGDKMLLNPDLRRMVIYDTDGKVGYDSVVETDLNEPAQQPLSVTKDPFVLQAIKGMTLTIWSATEKGKPLYVIVAPWVEEWGRHRFSVAFYMGYDSLDVAAKASVWRIFWLSLGSLGLGVLIAILLSAQSLGPLEVLTRGAQDLADGRLERRIDLHTGDEFGVLASTFNQMAEKLARTISDLERSNRALGQMNLDLQQLDRVKSDLLANVSHELRTPLTAIQGYNEALGEGLLGDVNEQQRGALNVVQRNIHRLMGMIEQLLGFSRLESGRIKLERSAFDLGELAAHVVAGVKASRPAELNLQLEVLPNLPRVWGDPGRISQVIENLTTNAAKFTPLGAEIKVSVRRNGAEAEVVVADHGVGIPVEVQPKIFERFYQVDTSSTRRYGGMGLGLAIVREILASHQREIAVESEVGIGTTFRFCLPFATSSGEAPAESRGRRLLLIDDDLGFANLLADYLRRTGFVVDIVPTARAGFDQVVALEPDLVLLDRLLPDGDGFDLLARLKNDPRTSQIPVLVVSVRKERELGLRLGAAGYLVKPVQPSRVRDLILHNLGRPSRAPEVLVVNDGEPLRGQLLERLQADGFRARSAGTGREALHMVAEQVPALVLLNLAMPDLHGWEILRRLRGDPMTAETPVIVFSERPGGEAPARDLNVVDLAGQPFDVGMLVEEIERTLAPDDGQQQALA